MEIDGQEAVESVGPESQELNSLGGVAPVEPPAPKPVWADAVEKFPEGLRGLATEQFTTWDTQVNQKFSQIHEQYKPLKAYETFAQAQIAPEELQEAHAFAQMIKSDPEGVTRALAQSLGLTFAEAAEVIEESQSQEVNPEIESLRQAQQQMAEAFEEQQRSFAMQQEEARQAQSIEAEIEQINSTFGKMSQPVLNEVLQRAHDMSLRTGAPVSLTDAYKSLEQFVGAVQKTTPRPGALAPRTIPSGNAQPIAPPAKSLGQMTPAETRAYAAEVMARNLAQ